MPVQGLPDWRLPIAGDGDGVRIYVPYESDAPCALVPDRLLLAPRAGGQPDFRLDIVRRSDGSRPLHGLLAFRVEAHHAREAGLSLLRGRLPGASLRDLSFDTGFLRLMPAGPGVDIPPAVLAPMRLPWNGLGTASFQLMLEGEAARLLEGMLQSQTLLLSAYAEMELSGVAPRVPLQVEFDPAELIRALVSRVGGLQAPRQAFLRAFLGPLEPLGLKVTGSWPGLDSQLVAEALTDWLRVRLGRFVPAVTPDGDGWLALPEPGQLAPALHRWDLATPIAAPRPVTLSLNPFEAAAQLVKEQGLDAVIHRVDVPGLQLGGVPVSLWAALPDGLDAAVGVSLHAPPTRYRPQALWSGPIPLLASKDYAASYTLRFSPAEPPEFTFRTYVELADGSHVEAKDEVSARGGALSLGPGDFPVDFCPLQASARLLQLAELRGMVRTPRADGTWTEVAFSLTPEQPRRVFVLPAGAAAQATVALEALERNGTRSLRLELPLSAAASVDLMSLPGFGPHSVDVTCAIPEGGRAVVVELRGEASRDVTRLLLTPARPSQRFTWYADSPFQPGFVYRLQGAPDWSEPRPPSPSLQLPHPDEERAA